MRVCTLFTHAYGLNLRIRNPIYDLAKNLLFTTGFQKNLSERLLLTVLPLMMKKAARTIGSDRKVRSQQAALNYK